MILQSNAAFEFIRTHKDVDPSIEDFVMKRVKNRISNKDLLTVFENGIAGQYGKIYTLDAQTLLGWVDKFQTTKNNSKNYLESGLAPLTISPNDLWEWDKEANKCYAAFISGLGEENFHPAVYDWMMVDGKIQMNAYSKYYKFEPMLEVEQQLDKINRAKQKVLRDVFSQYRSKGYQTVYFI